MDPKLLSPKVVDYSAWQFWVGVVGQYLVAGAVGIYVWITNKDKARQKDIDTVKECTSIDIKEIKDTVSKEIGQVGQRVTRLEESVISHEDLAKVYDRINAVSDQVSELRAAVKGIKGSVDMIHQYLLNNGGKQ